MRRTNTSNLMDDARARELALNTAESFIVKAPAGSGKTELLTSRYLKLLGEVESPDEILAITFTRAATAEMRNRILSELEKARDVPPTATDDYKLELARRALHHADQQGWNLLAQPQRLRIETIDSFCASLARRTPILSRLGGDLNPTEDAAPIYRLAARRTLQQIGGDNTALSLAIGELLMLRDNNFGGCERLLAKMLEQRDQWSHAFVLGSESAWDADHENAVRCRLEAPFQRAIVKALGKASLLFRFTPNAIQELLAIVHFACRNLRESENDGYGQHLENICALENQNEMPGTTPEEGDAWQAIASFLLTLEGDWRKRPNKSTGFPVGSNEMKRRFEELRDLLGRTPELQETLCEIRLLPSPHYSDQQWQLLRHFFTALRHATAELRVAFAERNEIDFVELGMAAEQVLQNGDGEAAPQTGEQTKHLLVDEFQDISRRQYRLITQLVRGWDPADRRSCFLVGDPMQSIYLFRQAEVELFEGAYSNGLRTSEGTFPLSPLQLTKNFRADRRLVKPLNDAFAAIFSAGTDLAIQVPFTAAEGTPQAGKPGVYKLHTDFIRAGEECARETEEAHDREAEEMLRIIRQHRPAIEAAAASGGEYRVAILARAKRHLLHLVEHLKDASIPFRAVEMEQLAERQEVLDMLSLVRALVHPMDRIAWLSILRAPWCGLQLADLHILCGADDPRFADVAVPELLRERINLLSAEGRERAQRLHRVLQRASDLRSEQLSMQSFASLVERAWYSLSGPACVDATGRENVELFLRMLAELPNGEIDCIGEELSRRLQKLCARPDPETDERCGVVLMTIHKAKGLGFEVVLVPALERQTGGNESELLSWLERPVRQGDANHDANHNVDQGQGEGEGEDEILVAPIGLKGESSDALKRWVECQRKALEAEERKRLLYVACTRARKELHLFGVATVQGIPEEGGQVSDLRLTPGHPSSLLKTGWPAFEESFVAALPRWLERRGIVESEIQIEDTVLSFSTPMLPFPGPMDIDLAASADRFPRARLLRLRTEAFERHPEQNITVTVTSIPRPEQTASHRPEGSLLARAFGVVVHTMLERLARLLIDASVQDARTQVGGWKQQIVTSLVQQGVDPALARSQAARAVSALESTLDDPEGRWIMAPHVHAETETQWTGVLNGSLRQLRADRVFRAGRAPQIAGSECFWIIDYKTSEYSAAALDDFLARQRLEYEQQLASYADILRLQYGARAEVNVGLYYPLLKRLIWWQT